VLDSRAVWNLEPEMESPVNTQVDYYRDPRVRHAICTFLEGCEYIVGFGEAEVWKGSDRPFYSAPAGWPHLEVMLESGLDVFGSLWRTDATVGVIDIEYFNHANKGRAITDPGYALWELRPIVEQYLASFARYELPFMALVTGQGVQILFQVPFTDPVHERLVWLGGRNEKTLQWQYDLPLDGKRERSVPWYASLGSKGMFRVILKLSNDVMRRLQARREAGEPVLPTVYSDVHMGDPTHGLFGQGPEGISIDLTCYGDPLHMRDHRAPFSTHQKQRADDRYTEVYWAPLKVTLPFWTLEQYDEIAVRRIAEVQDGTTDFAFAASLADQVDCSVPTAAWAVDRVIDDIEASPLGDFFALFDNEEPDDESMWHDTYHRPGLLAELPPCVCHGLAYPDPHLLKPTNLQRLVRVLDGRGWHPKHIAGLIYSRYRYMAWGHYNAEKRANYWAEQYAAPLYDGTDDRRYMSCVEEQLRGFCIQPFCGHDLSAYAHS